MSMLTGHHPRLLLLVLLGLGGLGAGAIGVAAFGTVYLGQITRPGAAAAAHAFGVVTAAFAFVTLMAGALGYLATRAHQTRGCGDARRVPPCPGSGAPRR